MTWQSASEKLGLIGDTASAVAGGRLECRHTATVDDVDRPLMLSPVSYMHAVTT